MANPDKTEKATPKRRGEARKRGQVAKSSEVSQAFIFLAAICMLHIAFMSAVDSLGRTVSFSFQHIADPSPLNIFTVWGIFERTFTGLIPLLLSVLLASLIIGIVANVLQFGFLFTLYPLKPNFSKLNPIKGIQQVLFSSQTLVQLGKQIVKLSAVAFIIFLSMKDDVPHIYMAARMAPHDMLLSIEGLTFKVGIRFALFLIAVAMLDLFYMRYRMEESMKMSKQEVKDEYRSQEGNMELKGAVKSRQRAMARKRMMAAVPSATVVVTNPTHFAVALEWDELTMEAPVLVAKGADLLAKRIRDIATEHDVPIIENPPLARTLYSQVELDSPVPPDLYAAVAQVVAFVYRLKRKTIA